MASLAASAVFYSLRARAITDLEGQCNEDRTCPSPSAQSTIDRGKTMTTLANVSLGLGVVGLGVSVAWLLGRGGEATPAARAEGVFFGASPGGMIGGVTRRF